ncbi:hypothetical protein Tcan_16476 [Toxocara canis]|uniref:Uncharacterized protein n=2 Tax=Toxocara canis TaxID=6265 RepID=A0A0B2VRX1_TOXCA|nr:hypothetical protein Tcan_16476 [Toxocara canis]VDM24187.1 unnamed protein product [Toxocara canis]
MVPIADGMRKTIEQMSATMAEEMRKHLVATIRDVVSSLLPEMVRTLVHSLHSIFNSNCERLQTIEKDTANTLQSLKDTVAALRYTRRSTQQPVNSSGFTADVEKQQRRRSAVFIGIARPPQQRQERDVESVAEILEELNADGLPP